VSIFQEESLKIFHISISVHLNINFDSWPSETGWSIVHAEDHSQIYAAAPPGTYVVGTGVFSICHAFLSLFN
jgi:hypothetical protein